MAGIINGREYEFADISIVLANRDVIGLKSIEYKESQEKEPLYGKGNKPISIQKGNFAYEGSIGLTQSEVDTLKAYALQQTKSTSLMGLSLDITVCYGNPSKGDVMIPDKIFAAQFTEDSKGMSQGDKAMEYSLPFICLDIQYGTI